MEIIRDKLYDLMKNQYEGNYNRFAKELGIDPSHLYRFMNTGTGGGKKLVGAIIRYCRQNNLNFEEYIDI